MSDIEVTAIQLVTSTVHDVLVEELGRERTTRLMGKICERLADIAERGRETVIHHPPMPRGQVGTIAELSRRLGGKR